MLTDPDLNATSASKFTLKRRTQPKYDDHDLLMGNVVYTEYKEFTEEPRQEPRSSKLQKKI